MAECMKPLLKGTKNMRYLFLLIFSLFSIAAIGEPYISFQTQQACSACHINPTGGGMRTEYGSAYGTYQLPTEGQGESAANLGKLSDYFSIGGDLRYSFESTKTQGANKTASGFEVESGQIYIHVSNKSKDLSFYIDQQLAPGTAINREAFIIKKFDNGTYLKAGRMMPVLGIKLEDDTAFTRQVTGFNFDNSDNGIEYGIQSDNAIYTFFATNGTNAVSNDDNQFMLGARGEFWIDNVRVGGAVAHNARDDSERTMYSVFSGYRYEQIIFLGEVTLISNQGNIATPENDEVVALVEANWLIAQGHNLKVTEEYYDPNNDIDEDHRVRHSLIYEYTPIPSLQLRFGLRNKEAPRQFTSEQTDTFFVQSHFYF